MKNLLTLLFLLSAFISNAQTVSISSSAAPSNRICSGTNVTFTANISGFTNPSYKWYANGTEIPGAISSTYSSTSLTNGVQVYVKVTGATVDGAIVTNGLLFNLDAGNSASYAGSGTRWTDLSGNGNHGTLSGATLPTYSPDNGGSFVFNGLSSNVNLNKNASAIGIYNNSYTADAWVYPTDLGSDRGMFGDEQAVSRQGLHLIFRNGSIHQGHFGSDANAGSVTANSWYHIVFTYNKVTEEARMYKNGAYQGNGGIASYIGTTNIHLGQAFNNTGFFQGKGAVYKMYSRVLSDAEVATNYNALKDRFTSNGVNSNSNIITTTVNPAPSIPVITITGDACVNKTTLSTPAGQSAYAWYKDNVAISNTNSTTYSPATAGEYKVQVTSGTCSTMSAATSIAVCGVTADGRMRAITSPTTLVSHEGGVNFGTGVSELGTTVNATGISTTLGTIGATTAVVSGVISSTNARTTSIGVIYSTDSNFGTYSTSSTQSNVAAGTHAITLTSLSSLTNYYAKAFITNKAGTSYGAVISFTTLAEVPPTKVAITRASVGTGYGLAFTTQPQVTIQDVSGSTVTSSSAVVTATISSGGALVGTTTATASSGVATFSNLGIKGAATAYTITYTVSGLTPATQSVTPTALSIGSTGPGGGKVFYAATSGFACGPTLSETCYYLEVAPIGANTTKDWAVSANRTSSAGASGTVIGSGYQNTMAIINQGNSNSAAAYAQEYRGGSLSDWYLGTRLELYQIYVNRATIFTGTEVINTEFPGEYWTSTEANASQAYSYRIYDNQGPWPNSKTSNSVRPIRSF